MEWTCSWTNRKLHMTC